LPQIRNSGDTIVNGQSRKKFDMSKEEKLRDRVTVHTLNFQVLVDKQL